jgi:Heterokaryon incompatibility protein (HET)
MASDTESEIDAERTTKTRAVQVEEDDGWETNSTASSCPTEELGLAQVDEKHGEVRPRVEPGESIMSSVIRETMPELFVGDGMFADPANPTLSDMLEGIVTGGPDGEFLQNQMGRRTGVGLLPPDKASGKGLTLISEHCLPDDERYPGPLPWSNIEQMERAAEERDYFLRRAYGLKPVPGLCRRCRRMCLIRGGTLTHEEYVPLQFTSNKGVRFRPFGSWVQLLLRKYCRICRLVLSSIGCGTMLLHPFLRKIDPEAQYTQIFSETLPTGENVLSIEYGLRKFGILRMITNENFREVLRQAYEVDDVKCPFGKLQDPDSLFYDLSRQLVDVSLLKRWINNCEHDHGADCDQSWHSLGSGDDRPILLIDVLDQCLVEKPMKGVRYIALSYVRGNTVIPITKLNNLRERQLPKSLPQDLPATLQDATSLTRNLGERFLWIDALCIVQDDLNSKHSDIRRMDEIYSNAVVTLIALNGSSADAGLPGVRPGSRSPQHVECAPMGMHMAGTPDWFVERIDNMAIEDPKEHKFRLSANHIGETLADFTEMLAFVHRSNRNADLEPPEPDRIRDDKPWGMVAHPPSLKHVISVSPWDSRGWTMQERLLSRRCIYFSHDYVYFQCNRETLSETGGSIMTWADVEVQGGNKEEVERVRITNPLAHFRQPSAKKHTIESEHDQTTRQTHDFDGYAELIELYSKRQLSFQTDALNAVAGMLKVMQNRLGGDLIAGVPSQYLDLVMMWSPAEPLDRTTPIGAGANVFPTWSWTAWTSRKQFRLAYNSSGYDDPVREFAASDVDCFTMLYEGKLVKIFKSLGRRSQDDNTVMAPDVQRRRISEGQDDTLRKAMTGVGTAHAHKYTPYAIRMTQGVLGPSFGPNVLQFWAYTVSIEAFQFANIEGSLISEPEHGNQRGEQYVNSLLDSRGKHCGLLFKPQARSKYRGVMNKDVMEYVLISSFGDSTRRRYGIETIDQSVKPFDAHAFPWRGKGSGLVNVMLIEWFEDIAERFTVAQINRLAWENARPVRKHIRLV